MSDKFKSERAKFDRWILAQFPELDESLLKINDKYEYKDDNISLMFVGFCGGMLTGSI